MYTKYFGFSAKPFSLIPDARAIYFSRGHRAAFAMLEYGLLEQVGITVITGEVGAGKTTLVRHLLRRIDYGTLTLGLVSTTHRSFGSLLKWILAAFRIEAPAEDEGAMLQRVQDFLIEQYAEGRRTVVIIDEAQNATADDLESLRLLTNINADGNQLLQVLLVGQPQLLATFQDPNMSQLAQRVSAEYNLTPLSAPETICYINHRIQAVGGVRNIFETPAALGVYYYSGGVPRVVNTLCDGALVYAYAHDMHGVDLDAVLEVVKTKQIGGIHRPGIDSNPDREAVRQDIRHGQGVDMLALVG